MQVSGVLRNAQHGKKMGDLTRAARYKEEGGMDKKESVMRRFHGS